ncbi:alpha-amylase family glycosyl hydrolase [Geotalea uraniireducens]|uniref:Alpha amylase, catalytic region n=1 Tax=Geotalea uraniireducens (strain Rf4) TaxID=351605 RepID=A5GET1_GEOUR|nr:alpha-amylase family glycosyl hydrolase [Geotalea uraniireducens]ABQ25936.1 alpha amylase, catalytic region [Geotalea uraniireducens Rf4]
MDRVSDIDFAALCAGRKFQPSPLAWEDQVLYFLLLDRFSDDKEQGYRGNDGEPVTGGHTLPYDPAVDNGNAVATPDNAAVWRDAGGKWCHGNLRGLTGKIGYLKRMGVTAIWLSPIFKQVSFQPTYHGYGIQDFLSVDPHFGSVADLGKMVRTAHANGIYVILDIILNHSGNVFTYAVENGEPPWRGGTYPVVGFNNEQGAASLPFQDYEQNPMPVGKDDAVWPGEFQNPACFTQKGRIRSWDYDPEFREGDFFDLKDINHGYGPDAGYTPSPALLNLCEIYKYWIAAADIDGYRIDTVKHMDIGATRFFVSAIKEFAQTIGKENFLLVGEITGGRERAFDTLEETGLDAALGIDDVQLKLEGLMKGENNPEEYFNLFRNSLLVRKDSHVWFKDKVVTMINDHDQVCKGEHKARFCAAGDGSKLALGALALNAMTIGIPCIYYGTEQRFDGRGDWDGADRYIRETMFGGSFGAFRSKERHFFDESGDLFRELADILKLREEKLVLRRGRQYLREISGDGVNFDLPRIMGGRMLSVVAWSRILDKTEMVLAVNTDPDNAHKAWVLMDAGLHPAGSSLKCVYSTQHGDEGALVLTVQRKGAAGDIAAVELDVPAAGFVVLE